MILVTRFILALAVLLQPVRVLVAQRCVGLPAISSVSSAASRTDCSCCLTGSDAGVPRAECPFAAQQFAGCDCTESQADKPLPLPGERRPEHAFQVLTLVRSVVGVFNPEPMVPGPALPASPRAARASGHTLHQLQCRWLI